MRAPRAFGALRRFIRSPIGPTDGMLRTRPCAARVGIADERLRLSSCTQRQNRRRERDYRVHLRQQTEACRASNQRIARTLRLFEPSDRSVLKLLGHLEALVAYD